MKSLHWAYRFLAFFFRPVRENLGFFLAMLVLVALCDFSLQPRIWFLSRLVILANVFVDVYLVCCLLMLVPRRWRKWIRGLICFLMYALTLVDTFCIAKYDTAISPTLLMLVAETDSREAGEFLATALTADVLQREVGLVIAAGLFHLALAWCLWRYKDKVRKCLTTGEPLWGTLMLLALAGALTLTGANKLRSVQLFGKVNIGEIEHQVDNYNLFFYTSAGRLAFSILCNDVMANELVKLRDRVDKPVVDSCSYTSPCIVLVIGESANRHHSQLYGYPLPTTPRQKTREADGSLARFTDAVCGWNLTSYVFKNLFSMHAVGQDGTWCDYALFPVLFRKAGYSVAFLTNQFVQKQNKAMCDVSGGFFLNDPKLSAAMFDVRNAETHPFDDGVLCDYDSLQARGMESNNLVILHLVGQHIQYSSRCPQGQKKFSAATYQDFRQDLSPEQREVLADYDNATHYNDSILDEILTRFEEKEAIVVFLSDHGEECYEGSRGFYGRSHSPRIDPDFAKHEFEVPMWIWASASYRRKHPDIWQAVIQAKDKPYMTDAISHTLLFLAGIHSKEYHAEFDVLSPQYNAKRKRLLRGEVVYDSLFAGKR